MIGVLPVPTSSRQRCPSAVARWESLNDSLVKKTRIRRKVETSATPGADQVAGEIRATPRRRSAPVTQRARDELSNEGRPADVAAPRFSGEHRVRLGRQLTETARTRAMVAESGTGHLPGIPIRDDGARSQGTPDAGTRGGPPPIAQVAVRAA